MVCLTYSVNTIKFVPENYTEKFDTLKLTMKNNIKQDSTENHTETIPLLFRNEKKTVSLPHFFI